MDILISCLSIFAFLWLTDYLLSANGYHGPSSDHFDGKVFYSYGETLKVNPRNHRRIKFLKWILSQKKPAWTSRELKLTTVPKTRVFGGELIVTFVNHATLLIQTEGKNILTDPIWSKRASPFSFMGPARFQDPGVKFEDLPPIDLVLISHNHYDHMDIATLERIKAKWDPQILVGLGNADYLRVKGFTTVKEMDWWDKADIASQIRVICVPGQHFSSRALSDRNKTLWCGFVIETKNGNIYFAGDTGYGEFVRTIGDRYKEFRLGLLPIGAFRPEWFMGPVHISPDQAMQIHKELNIQTSVGVHFGTFHLAGDGQDEPETRINELLVLDQGSKVDFRVLKNGEAIEIK